MGNINYNVVSAISANLIDSHIQGGAPSRGVDTSLTANTLTVALTPAITGTPTNGQKFFILPANTNTGPATISFNGLAAISIVGADGSALIGNEIKANGYLELEYSSSLGKCVMVDTTGAAQLQNGSYLSTVPSQFDNSSKLASTSFINRVGMQASGITTVTTSTTLTASAFGGTVEVNSSSAITVTLPSATNSLYGGRIEFINIASGAVTIQRAGTDLINTGTGNITSIVLNNSDTLVLENTGTGQWIAISGSAQLPYSSTATGANWTTPAQFDSSTKLSTTAFVQRALGNLAGISAYSTAGNITLAASQVGTLIDLASGFSGTVTLPLAGGCTPGSAFVIFNGSGANVTIQRNGTDSIFPAAALVTSMTLLSGDTLYLAVAGSSSWIAFSGAAQLPYAGVMSGPYWTTPTQFDNTTRFATTAFVQRAIGSLSGFGGNITANKTLAITDAGKWYSIEATGLSITLPLASTVPAGTMFLLRKRSASAATASIVHNSSTIRNVLATETNQMTFTSDGASSYIMNDWPEGPVSMSLAGTGYQKLPSGLIIQWGVGTFSTTGTANTFPISFPSVIGSLTLGNPNSTASVPATSGVSLSGYTGNLSAGAAASIYWIAIGY